MGISVLNVDNARPNRVMIRTEQIVTKHFFYKKNSKKLRSIIADASVFPLYCTSCNSPQPNLYVHEGSRYGQVGTVKCSSCGKDIAVIDHDNIVASIFINNYPSNEIFFQELFLLDIKYLEALGKHHFQNIEERLINIEKDNTYFISVDKLRSIIEEEMHISTSGQKKYITDERFSVLPEDINRFIEALINSGVEVPIK
ncbi:hypothetical protein [Inconstantimicrobium mannanitabidum]|uniref:Uncharacterized protein n=1 Tax=Inconstantimicrobium mannanitabidum TaxID=1604901 RepID=A0ACB5R7C7_9CLOT|nr:hypothetical protein [Clostridium sp. TW13]GKX64861.1 hypothetical protein rsdtw13_01190 [Clostridium sp. TW13]